MLIRPAKKTSADRVFDSFVTLSMIFMLVITLYPFLNILAISFNDSVDSVKGSIYLWPRIPTLQNYLEIFKYANIPNAFMISVLRTTIGTLFSIIATSMCAFVLSRRDFVLHKFISVLFILMLYVSGGLIPEFLVLKGVGLLNNFWIYIVPSLISAFNVIVFRSFIDQLPSSLYECAQIDGANDFTIFIRIIIPLCVPVMATISLFVAVGQWNSWIDTFLYCSSREDLFTLQYEMIKILQNANQAQSPGKGLLNEYQSGAQNMVSPQSIQMAITIVATVPILVVYPFIQKYFVSGMTLGAVKG